MYVVDYFQDGVSVISYELNEDLSLNSVRFINSMRIEQLEGGGYTYSSEAIRFEDGVVDSALVRQTSLYESSVYFGSYEFFNRNYFDGYDFNGGGGDLKYRQPLTTVDEDAGVVSYEWNNDTGYFSYNINGFDVQVNVSIASQSEFTSFAYSSVFASQSQSNDIDTQSIVAEYQDFSLASVDDLIDLSVMNIFSGEGSPKLDNDDNDTADFNSIYGEIAFYEQSLDPLKINVATSKVLYEEIYVVRSTSEDFITTRLETYDSQVDPITGAVCLLILFVKVTHIE